MMNNRIKSVKEIKKLINEVLLPGYCYKTNFSCADFLIDINYKFIIKAELVKKDNRMIYVFVLDTQFLSEKVISYEEMKMVINISLCIKIIVVKIIIRKIRVSKLLILFLFPSSYPKA